MTQFKQLVVIACFSLLLASVSHIDKKSHGLNIVLDFNEAESESWAFDPIPRDFSGAILGPPVGLSGLFEYAEDFYQDVFEDSHTLTINYWYEDLGTTETPDILGVHTLVSQSGGRETEANIRIDTKDGVGGSVLTDWFIDLSPDNSTEFDMQQTLWQDISATTRGDWYNNFDSSVPDTFEVGYEGSATATAAIGNFDMLSVVMHEVGHALGMSTAINTTSSETDDGDYDFNSDWVFGATLAAETANDPENMSDPDDNSNIAHLENTDALMTPGIGQGMRRLPSHTDLFAMAAAHNYVDLDIPRREFYGGTSWKTDSNWTGDAEPGSADDTYVRHGGTVSVLNNIIGSSTGEAGNLIVEENSTVRVTTLANLYVTSEVIVGRDSTGTIEVGGINSDLVVGTDLELGSNGGSRGTLEISSLGYARIENDLIAGRQGIGTVDQTGGTLSVGGEVFVGLGNGSSGNYIISGSGSLLETGSHIRVGRFEGSSGEITFTDDTIANIGNGLLLGYDGGEAIVNIEQGSRVFVEGTVQVGRVAGAASTLKIESGGDLVAQSDVHIASGSGSSGQIILTRSGSKLLIGQTSGVGDLYVGRLGSGTLDVSDNALAEVAGTVFVGFSHDGVLTFDGGTLDAGEDMELGSNAAGDGTLHVIDGMVDIGDDFYAGRNGEGTVDQTGGTLSVGGELLVGLGDGSQGKYTISGTDALLETGSHIRVGRFAGSAGEFTVTHDSIVNIGNGLLLGYDGGEASISIEQGSRVFVEGSVQVGRSAGATSTLSIESGGDLVAQSDVIIANGNGSRGQITLTRSGSKLLIGQASGVGDLYVGRSGDGTLDVSNNALAEVAGTLFVGRSADGELNVADSIFNIGQEFSAGENGAGNGTIRFTSGNLQVGSSGNENVYIGKSGTGTLILADGTVATFADDLEIGLNADSQGTVIVGGFGALTTLDVNDGVGIGVAGSGTMNVLVNGHATMGNTNVAQAVGSTGTVLVSGSNASLDISRLSIGGTFSSAGGAGEVRIDDGAIVSVAQELTIWGDGTAILEGGHLTAQTIDHTRGGTFEVTDGDLSVSAFNGVMIQDGGTLLIGGSPGTLTVSEDYDFNAGLLEIELGGLVKGEQYDFLDVAGDLNLAGGSLDISLIAPFTLSDGQQFDIVDVGGSLAGTFDSLSEGSLVGSFGGVDLMITYLAGDGNDIALLAVAAASGDFDDDGDTDGADFLAWQRGESPDPRSAEDLAEWQANYGAANSLGSTQSVPEPTSSLLLCMGAILVFGNQPKFCDLRNES